MNPHQANRPDGESNAEQSPLPRYSEIVKISDKLAEGRSANILTPHLANKADAKRTVKAEVGAAPQ